jgi:hypothetical protein
VVHTEEQQRAIRLIEEEIERERSIPFNNDWPG